MGSHFSELCFRRTCGAFLPIHGAERRCYRYQPPVHLSYHFYQHLQWNSIHWPFFGFWLEHCECQKQLILLNIPYDFFIFAFKIPWNSVAGSTSAGYSYISEFHSTATAPRAAAFISFGLNCGWLSMSPIAILIIPMDWTFSLYFVDFKPWRLFMLCTSFINLLNAILAYLLPESPKFLLAMNRKDEALDVLKRVYAINTGNSKNVMQFDSVRMFFFSNKKSSTFFPSTRATQSRVLKM